MKVYFHGEPVLVEDVTYDLLCSQYCYVDWSKDRHIPEFSAQVQADAEQGLGELLRFVGFKDVGCFIEGACHDKR